MSQRDADTFISNNEREFILKALAEECRLDGRRPYDFRKPKFEFSLDDRSATVALGSTRVMAVVSASLEAPYPDRPSEGPLRFNVEFSPMASPAFEPGKPGDDAIQVARLLERGLRQSGAVDQEALCVVAGMKVWALRVDCHVLDHGGNLVDGAFLAALAALLAFRKPEVEVALGGEGAAGQGEGGGRGGGGGGAPRIVVHPPEVREPLPLTIHHLPVAVTFALFQDGDTLLVDPSRKEAAASAGSVTLVLNPAREVCCVHKADGVGLSTAQLMRCVRLAGERAEALVTDLKAALERHEVARVQARVRRHGGPAGSAAGGGPEGRHVMVLGAKDPAAAAAGAPKPAGIDIDAEMAVEQADSGDDDEDEDEDDDESSDEEAAGADDAGAAAAAAVAAAAASQGRAGGGGDADMADASASGGGARGARKVKPEVKAEPQPQPKGARLSGPLLPGGATKGAKGAKRATPDAAAAAAAAGGGLSANKRGKDNVGFDELEAIAAVIAGVPPGGPPAGAPEPSLAAAVKPGKAKQRRPGK